MEAPLISVIIPCYNQGIFLAEALQSVIGQTFQDWECIIVNDGSPDETETVATAWCAKDSRFRYFYKANGGLSHARNFGISKATSDLILTLDADDKFAPTFMEKGIAKIKQREDLGIVSCYGYRFIGETIINGFEPDGKTVKDYLFNNAAIGNSLFRKKCWETVGGYDENMKHGYEDWDFYLRISALGWNTFIIPEHLFFYRQRENSMRVVALNQYDTQIRAYILKKNKALYQQHYELMVDDFLAKIAAAGNEVTKVKRKPEYRIGQAFLYPLRKIKSLLS